MNRRPKIRSNNIKNTEGVRRNIPSNNIIGLPPEVPPPRNRNMSRDCIPGVEVELWDECYNIEETTNLNLSNSGLTGEIPSEIGNLINLTNLNLRSNQLTGEIPSSIGNLTNLEYLRLEYNQLEGEIPSSIGNLTNLTDLYLYFNQLTGEIPSEIGNLTNLESLRLSSNQLTGEIPPEIGDLTNLDYLNLGGNQLTGEIPSEIGNLTNLYHLYLNDNQLTGVIPTTLCNLNLAWGINLANNMLCVGAIPGCMSAFLNIGNQYPPFMEEQDDDVCPEECGHGSVELFGYCWDVATTTEINLTIGNGGVIPPEIGDLTNLEYLRLFDMNLSGEIPPEIGNLTNLTFLQIERNWDLTGEIPPEIGNLTNLEVLYLKRSDITGVIPSEIGNLTNLEVLDLSENQLHGNIPTELYGLTNLRYLKLSKNALQIPFLPEEIGNLESLIELDLSYQIRSDHSGIGMNLWQTGYSLLIPNSIQNIPLQRIYLRDTRIGLNFFEDGAFGEGIPHVFHSLPQQLDTLDLRDNYINCEMLPYMHHAWCDDNGFDMYLHEDSEGWWHWHGGFDLIVNGNNLCEECNYCACCYAYNDLEDNWEYGNDDEEWGSYYGQYTDDLPVQLECGENIDTACETDAGCCCHFIHSFLWEDLIQNFWTNLMHGTFHNWYACIDEYTCTVNGGECTEGTHCLNYPDNPWGCCDEIACNYDPNVSPEWCDLFRCDYTMILEVYGPYHDCNGNCLLELNSDGDNSSCNNECKCTKIDGCGNCMDPCDSSNLTSRRTKTNLWKTFSPRDKIEKRRKKTLNLRNRNSRNRNSRNTNLDNYWEAHEMCTDITWPCYTNAQENAYNPDWNMGEGCVGCTDPIASNYCESCAFFDGDCEYNVDALAQCHPFSIWFTIDTTGSIQTYGLMSAINTLEFYIDNYGENHICEVGFNIIHYADNWSSNQNYPMAECNGMPPNIAQEVLQDFENYLHATLDWDELTDNEYCTLVEMGRTRNTPVYPMANGAQYLNQAACPTNDYEKILHLFTDDNGITVNCALPDTNLSTDAQNLSAYLIQSDIKTWFEMNVGTGGGWYCGIYQESIEYWFGPHINFKYNEPLPLVTPEECECTTLVLCCGGRGKLDCDYFCDECGDGYAPIFEWDNIDCPDTDIPVVCCYDGNEDGICDEEYENWMLFCDSCPDTIDGWIEANICPSGEYDECGVCVEMGGGGIIWPDCDCDGNTIWDLYGPDACDCYGNTIWDYCPDAVGGPFNCSCECMAPPAPNLDHDGYDCREVCGGTAVEDECGVCEGGGPQYPCPYNPYGTDTLYVCYAEECPEQPPYPKGDVNLDYEVNIFDVAALFDCLTISGEDCINQLTPEQRITADLNEDREIDILDVVILVDIILARGNVSSRDRGILNRVINRLLNSGIPNEVEARRLKRIIM